MIHKSELARQEFISELLSKSEHNTVVESDVRAAVKKFEEVIGVNFKKNVIKVVVFIFIASVLILWAGLGCVAKTEAALIAAGRLQPSERVITEKVILSLIVATVSQVAISFGLMMKFMFGNNAPAQDIQG